MDAEFTDAEDKKLTFLPWLFFLCFFFVSCICLNHTFSVWWFINNHFKTVRIQQRATKINNKKTVGMRKEGQNSAHDRVLFLKSTIVAEKVTYWKLSLWLIPSSHHWHKHEQSLRLYTGCILLICLYDNPSTVFMTPSLILSTF